MCITPPVLRTLLEHSTQQQDRFIPWFQEHSWPDLSFRKRSAPAPCTLALAQKYCELCSSNMLAHAHTIHTSSGLMLALKLHVQAKSSSCPQRCTDRSHPKKSQRLVHILYISAAVSRSVLAKDDSRALPLDARL